jgi:hypothetical protein
MFLAEHVAGSGLQGVLKIIFCIRLTTCVSKYFSSSFSFVGTPDPHLRHALQPHTDRLGNVQRSGHVEQSRCAHECAIILQRKSGIENGGGTESAACYDYKLKVNDVENSYTELVAW